MSQYIFYGTPSKAPELIQFLRHMIQVNEKAAVQGQLMTPVCIWGRHGVGKTEIVGKLAEDLGYDFVYIAPAQFEEMGDLLGMPGIEGGSTVFHAPEWVPSKEGPGILLLDDVNRADDRILRGIMQLLQKYELVSWKLPSKWHIILTANPDGGDYSVTPMDDAMLTRMAHISLEFDPDAWIEWAKENHIDQRGIDFIKAYPEIVSGERTTPRTLVQFFQALDGIDDLEQNLGLVRTLGDACLDRETVSTFIGFIRESLGPLMDIGQLLGTKNFQDDVYVPLKSKIDREGFRVDILSMLGKRIMRFLEKREVGLSTLQKENLRHFLMIDFIPNDLRLKWVQQLNGLQQQDLTQVITHPELVRRMLNK
ncbi:MAG: AAA family ATPase [Bacteroidota bacterium]